MAAGINYISFWELKLPGNILTVKMKGLGVGEGYGVEMETGVLAWYYYSLNRLFSLQDTIGCITIGKVSIIIRKGFCVRVWNRWSNIKGGNYLKYV